MSCVRLTFESGRRFTLTGMVELRISELAGITGVPATTLRFYEHEGLLPAERSPNGYRVYDDRSQDRLAFITAAKRLSLSLPEIKQLLEVWESDSCASVKAELRPAVAHHITRVDESITALTTMRRVLLDGLTRLNGMPDSDRPCDPNCTWLTPLDTGASSTPTQPVQPTACTLDAGDRHDRIDQWHRELAQSSARRVQGGIVITAHSEQAGVLARLASAEQRCCAFLDFTLTFSGHQVCLAVTGDPADAAEDLLPPALRERLL